MLNKHTRPSAFSLVELAIVLMIIAVIIAGLISASGIVARAKLYTARTLTQSSPVNSITGLSLWLEGSYLSSFASTESDSGKALSAWYDSNSMSTRKNNATQSTTLNKPTYSNSSINNITTVAFDGTNSYFNVDGSFLNNSDYTFFIVEKRLSDKSDNYFIGNSAITTENQNVILGYSEDNLAIHSQAGTNHYTSVVWDYNSDSVKPRLFSFTQSSSAGKKTYINGILAGQSVDAIKPSNISTLTIGKGYNGQIGEIIAFNKALGNNDREDIEKYLSKKWGIINYGIGSCPSGRITNTGCAPLDGLLGHWVLASSSAYSIYSGSHGDPVDQSSVTCDSAHNGAYAFDELNNSSPASGPIWSTSGSTLWTWMGCYCTNFSCTEVSPCGGEYVILATSPSDPAFSLYKCVYP